MRPRATERVFVVAYDVADDRRRLSMSRLLGAHGDRVQWSVFEVVATPDEIAALIDRAVAAPSFDPGEDSLRCYALCAECRRQTAVRGLGTGPPTPGSAVVV